MAASSDAHVDASGVPAVAPSQSWLVMGLAARGGPEVEVPFDDVLNATATRVLGTEFDTDAGIDDLVHTLGVAPVSAENTEAMPSASWRLAQAFEEAADLADLAMFQGLERGSCVVPVCNPLRTYALFGKRAESLNWLTKGTLVHIGGEMDTRTYEKNGTTHHWNEVLADRVDVLSSKSENQPEQYGGPASEQGPEAQDNPAGPENPHNV